MNDQNECQPYVDHLRLAHRHLHEAIRGVAAMVDEFVRTKGANRNSLNERLKLMREELSNHFTEEEAGGCLEQAVSRCPSMLPELKALEGEHLALQNNLDQVAALTQATDATSGEKLLQEFRAFSKRLLVHEAAENRILAYGFGADDAHADADADFNGGGQ